MSQTSHPGLSALPVGALLGVFFFFFFCSNSHERKPEERR